MRALKLLLKIVATGSATMLLAACYGVVTVMYGVPSAYSGVVRARKADATPIPAIKVSWRFTGNSDEWRPLGSTDAQGRLAYRIEGAAVSPVTLLLDDVDGPANGGIFASAEVPADHSDITVKLTEIQP